jgi:hypothetical protein
VPEATFRFSLKTGCRYNKSQLTQIYLSRVVEIGPFKGPVEIEKIGSVVLAQSVCRGHVTSPAEAPLASMFMTCFNEKPPKGPKEPKGPRRRLENLKSVEIISLVGV